MGGLAATTAVVAMLALGVAPASAAELLSTTVQTKSASARNCISGVLTGASVATRSATVPSAGWVTARLRAGSGDWDLALYDRTTGKRVAGSTFFGASEVAQGMVFGRTPLTVQACRRSGRSRSARIEVVSKALPTAVRPRVSLVRVLAPTRARRQLLADSGLDLAEHGGNGYLNVVLHGPADALWLRKKGFSYVNTITDVAARTLSDSLANRRYAARVRKSALPSGRTTYRRLDDYNQEMKDLAAKNPTIVKRLTLPLKTLTGRSVEGIEISTNVSKVNDGKPVFFQMGAHHAREWPSAEHAMEWAYELVNGYKANNARVRRLVGSTRTIVVPVVNTEGFVVSREAVGALDNGRGGPDETANLVVPYEYQRKNCRINNPDGPDPAQGDCTQVGKPNLGITQFGVDPNRNYGALWGGPGASADGPGPLGGDYAQDYRGGAPFSEAESRNIRELVSKRHVTTLITNHTFTGLVLRPPGLQRLGPPIDEPIYKALGDSMAAANGYKSQLGYQLYDTTGTTEDWTYPATGGLGFTFEIGPNNFHPPFADTVAEYQGTAPAMGAGKGGNREAYFRALENTAATARHSLISGNVPEGARLRLRKSFKTATSPVENADGDKGATRLFDDALNTVMDVSEGQSSYRWHINPSTRPIVAKAQGRTPTGGSPSPAIVSTGNPPPLPPCPTYFEAGAASCAAGGLEDRVFTVPVNSPTIDNGFVNIRLDWVDPNNDYDLEIFKADAAGNAIGDPISSSANSGNHREQTSIGPDPVPGKYVARVINYASTEGFDLRISFEGPAPFVPARKETWTLTCESPVTGRVGSTQQLLIERGQRKAISFGSGCRRIVEAGRCVGTARGVTNTSLAGAKLGRSRKSQRRRLKVSRLRRGRRAGLDRYCVRGGGVLRVGYPTKRFNGKVSRRTRKRYKSKAIFAVTSSKRFRINRLRVGARVRTLRKRLRGERSFKVGRIRWYTVPGRRSRLIFSTRKGKIREVGLASKRLTSTRRGTVRLLRAWDKRG